MKGRWVGDGRLLTISGRLFEVGANSRLGAYSNKYGKNLSSFSPVTSESNPLTL